MLILGWPKLGALARFFLEPIVLCVKVWWVGGERIRKNNGAKIKLNPGIKWKPRYL